MQPEQKFYKTRVVFEVLSEGPIPGHADLEYIAKESYDGRYVGRFSPDGAEETVLTGKQMADALYDFGSDPGFFSLNDDGEYSEEIY